MSKVAQHVVVINTRYNHVKRGEHTMVKRIVVKLSVQSLTVTEIHLNVSIS